MLVGVVRTLTVVILLLTAISGDINCGENCQWTSWYGWNCGYCCNTVGFNQALRQRGICCQNSSDVSWCLQFCNEDRINLQETGPCPNHCPPCLTTPTDSTTMSIQTTTQLTTTQSTTQPSMQSKTKPTTQSSTKSTIQPTTLSTTQSMAQSMANIHSRTRMASVPMTSGIYTTLLQTPRKVPTIEVISLGDLPTARSSLLRGKAHDCLDQCAGKDHWDSCFDECFCKPCFKMLTIVSPCLFVLGVVVGSSVTCYINYIIKRKEKKEATNSVVPLT